MNREQRQHRRLAIRLPLECYPAEEMGQHPLRSVTSNISTGGLYFEAELSNGFEQPALHSLLTVELTVPPGEGHFPYEGHLKSTAEVTRCERLEPSANGSARGRRIGIAARFREPLKLAF